MKILLFFLLAIVYLPVLAAPKEYGSVTVSEIRSIYDADTFKVNIAEWPDIIGKSIFVRVLGVDAPEIRGKCESEKAAAREAKMFTVEKLRSAKTVELRRMKRGKYFRILAEVYLNGVDLADLLISAGHARPYDGGTRLGWCE
jgi:endonuclease YncB( thermonuclease family)